MPRRILLVRHCQSEANAAGRLEGKGDSPLTEAGREQAERVAAFIAAQDIGPATVIVSPQARARATAEAILAACGWTAAHDHRIREGEFGHMEDISYTQLGQHMAENRLTALHDVDHGGETRGDVADRFWQALSEVLAATEGPLVAVTNHLYITFVDLRTLARTPFAACTHEDHLTSVAFILALTWFLMRCVKSVSTTVVNLNPYDVADNLKARRILTQTRVLSRSAYFIIALLGLWWSLQHRRYLAAAQGLLQERADQAQQLAALSRHVVSAQEEERRRLAADLHDQSGANLAAIQMNLKALERRLAPADADDRELFHETSALLAETVGQIRDFCADLRPASLDPAGLVEAIAGALARFARRTGAETSFDSAGYAVRQPAELEIVIFRLVQEALLNCAKHARARHVTVRLQSAAPGQVSLEVADDGIGFDPQAAQTPGDGLGQGLQLMQERARLVRGRLDVQSASGLGTRVRFERT